MTKDRPFGVTLIAVLAGIAAILAIIHTLQLLHLFPIFLGPVTFFTFDLLGAVMWGILALIYIWVTRGLWNLDPQAWLFVVVLSSLNLILAFVQIIGASSWQAMLPTIIINGLILIYSMTGNVKGAFGQT